jgi:dTDP-4-amino-4,6-dideoxygalactose transaminase
LKIPLLNLKAQHDPIHKELMDAIEQVLKSQNFILGPEVKKLEDCIASYCQTEFAIGVSSGTDALLVALMALEVGPRDEVITTPFSFFATAGVIARVGAKPVFVDIDPATFNINPRLIEAAITSRTKIIIPVHLYGQCADMKPILELARKHNIFVIEDAAQAIGAEYRDERRAGSMGTMGCLSFFPSKNLGALGDGGMVITNDKTLSEKIRTLRVHGGKPKYYHQMIGGNFRLDTLHAAVLNVKLNYLDGWTKRRQENARQYVLLFRESGLLEKVGLHLPDAVYEDAGILHYHIYNQFVIRVPDRDQLREYLKQDGIGTEIYYPVPFHLQDCFRCLGHRMGDFPEAERAAKETLALPICPELNPPMQSEVVEQIRKFDGI